MKQFTTKVDGFQRLNTFSNHSILDVCGSPAVYASVYCISLGLQLKSSSTLPTGTSHRFGLFLSVSPSENMISSFLIKFPARVPRFKYFATPLLFALCFLTTDLRNTLYKLFVHVIYNIKKYILCPLIFWCS